jgi:hypothetical protein
VSLLGRTGTELHYITHATTTSRQQQSSITWQQQQHHTL